MAKLKFAPHGGRQWLAALGRLGVLVVVLMTSLLALLKMPGSSFSGPLPRLTAVEERGAVRLAAHVRTLADDIGPRNIWTAGTMEKTADYLRAEFSAMGYEVREQEVASERGPVFNLEVEIPGQDMAPEIVVVGAHYDTVFACPGANDNGSGVAVLLELARLLKDSRPQRTIRLVAFANEEPPFFLNKSMGSRVYAMRCRERMEDITAMLALETLGSYSDKPGSQGYPMPLSHFYPDRANFIAFVGNLSSRGLVRRTLKAFRRHGHFPSEGLAAPFFVTGVGWSDHWSFWEEGFPAIMVTDTAFYRYDAYHTAQDTPEKLDYQSLARVVSGLLPTVLELAGSQPEHTLGARQKSGAKGVKSSGTGLGESGLLAAAYAKKGEKTMITLPKAALEGQVSVEAALQSRLSMRNYGPEPLSLAELSQLLWAAQGITRSGGRRTAPSAGALYPLEIYVVAAEVGGLEPGVYHYHPHAHGLEAVRDGDQRQQLAAAALGQGSIARAPVNLVLTAVYERTAAKYGRRARRYVHMEIGHAGQNIYLQATALGLGTVMVGAFDDAGVQRLLGLDEEPLAIMPVGRLP